MITRIRKVDEGHWQLVREYEVNRRKFIQLATFDGTRDDLVRAANKTRELALKDKGQ